MLADPHQANVGGIFNYDLFFKLLHRLFDIEVGIVGLRFIRLFSYLVGAWALCIFWKNTHSEKSISPDVYLLGLLGLLAGYAFLPSSLSYNSISVVLACFWLALISKKIFSWPDYFALGLILGLTFYVKITTCLVLGSLTLGIAFHKKEVGWKLILSLILPFLTMEFLFFLFLEETGLSRIIVGLDLMNSRSDYGYFLLIKYVAVGVFWLFLIFLPFWSTGYYHRKSRINFILFACISVSSLISIFISTSITEEWSHAILLISAGFFGFLFGKYGFRNLAFSKHLSFCLLIGMPFFLYFGSNVYWLRLGIHYWVFWILALMMYFPLFPRILQNRLKIGVGLVSLVLVINGIWLNPFGQEPLWKANQKWVYNSGNSILLTQNQVMLLTDIKKITDPFPQDEFLAFYRNPGILYMLDKNSPKSPGYWSRSHLNSYFPEGINFSMIIYSPSDSLPQGDWNTYKQKEYQMPNGEEIVVLWK